MRRAIHQSWSRLGGWLGLAAVVLLSVPGCGQTVEVGRDDALETGGVGGNAAGGVAGSLSLGGVAGSPTSGAAGRGGAPVCMKTACRGKEYQCGNCDDDDGDGLVDALDPDCLGPCDNDELGLSTGLNGNQSAACRQDCYFDGDAGPGNDKCEWSLACDPLSVAPDYPPSGEARCKYGSAMGTDCMALAATQPQTCLDACLTLVPNGCDCFGCCELPGGSGQYHFLGAGDGQGCQRDKLDDPLACPPCTQVPSCVNDCTKCETCVDKLPDPSCNPGSACPDGAAECGADTACGLREYCVTGCCRPAPEPI